MDGVDRADQKASYGVNLYRNCKQWKKAFFHMLEVAVVNTGVNYQDFYGPKHFEANKFRLNIAKELLEGYERTCNRTGRRQSKQMVPMTLTARHFISKVPGNSRPECMVCSQRKNKENPNGKRH